MALPRFFLADAIAEARPLPLTAADVHHLRDVLRMSAGEHLIAVDPAGRSFEVCLTSVGVTVDGWVVCEIATPQLPHVVLVQGVCKGEKMDLIVRQTAELGVGRVVPLLTSRVVVKLDAAKTAARCERWQRVAQAAAEQSGQSRVAQVAAPCDIVGLQAALADAAHTLVCWEDAHEAGIGETLRSVNASAEDTVAVVVGPEGGFSADEVDSLTRMGAHAVSLGQTILRTETAGTVACALTLYELGGLGGTGRG